MSAMWHFLLLSALVTTVHGLASPVVALPICLGCINTWCPSVIGPCVVVPPPGPGAMACLAVACGLPCGAACTVPFCFDDSTLFTTINGDVPVSALKKGDRILTEMAENGTDVFTEVTDIGYIEKDVEMLTLTLASGVSLTATENHEHFIAEGGRCDRKQGSELKVGMVMARTRNGVNGTIIAIAKSVSPGKWSLGTEPCSAYANGVLTATSCSKLAMPALSGANSEPPLRDRNQCTNSSGTQAFAYVLKVDGKLQSSELEPAALGRALENGSSWHLKAQFLD